MSDDLTECIMWGDLNISSCVWPFLHPSLREPSRSELLMLRELYFVIRDGKAKVHSQ